MLILSTLIDTFAVCLSPPLLIPQCENMEIFAKFQRKFLSATVRLITFYCERANERGRERERER